tara:strand:- start:5973 stop:7067 length:1095 start_codon:yes stop_codon:yes gene_type:complete
MSNPYTFRSSINIGSSPNDGTGDGLRTNMSKLIENDNHLQTKATANEAAIALIDTLSSNNETAINLINALLLSDETDLDTLQEVVDFIQVNKDDLDNLAIANIAGLVDALAAKTTLTAVFGTESLTETIVAASATLNVTTERFVTASNGTNTINLPTDPNLGRTVEVYNFGGNCTINGQSSFALSNVFTLTAAGQSVVCRFIRDSSSDEPQWSFIVGNRSTKGIIEDTNLFFTNARARAAISENSIELDYTPATGVMLHTGLRKDKITRPDSSTYTLLLTDMTVLYYPSTHTSGTYSLPESAPSDGQVFEIIDIELDATTYPLTISGNGRNILTSSSSASISLNTDGEVVRLKYLADENVYKKL